MRPTSGASSDGSTGGGADATGPGEAIEGAGAGAPVPWNAAIVTAIAIAGATKRAAAVATVGFHDVRPMDDRS
jgi:hypothetical protein